MVVLWVCLGWLLLACVVALPLARLLRDLRERQDAAAPGAVGPPAPARPHESSTGRGGSAPVRRRRRAATPVRHWAHAHHAPSSRPTLRPPSP